MTSLFDISRTVSTETKVWPTDTPFTFKHNMRLSHGDSVNLTTINLSPHTGTHADAPYHYDDRGGHPADVPIERYIGAAHVVTVNREHGGITPDDLAGIDLAGLERILIHTWVSSVPDGQWPEDFPYPTVELIDYVAEKGCKLFGVDMPSVDSFTSKTLPCHHRLFDHDIVNLETLQLSGIPDGHYELIALPLKLAGVCGSPLRAVLRTL